MQSGPSAVIDWHVEFVGQTVPPSTTQSGVQVPASPGFCVVQPATVAPAELVNDVGRTASHFQPDAQAAPPTVHAEVQKPRSVVVSEKHSQAMVEVVELQLVPEAVGVVTVVTHNPSFVWH
jgi:hypothetical protein